MPCNILVAQKDDEANAVNGSASMNGEHDAVDKTKGENVQCYKSKLNQKSIIYKN